MSQVLARIRALTVAGEPAIGRLLDQVLNQVPYDNSGYPTAEQVALVLHALADHTHIEHMLSDTVLVLGGGGAWPSHDRAHVIGRYFHALADEIHRCRDEHV